MADGDDVAARGLLEVQRVERDHLVHVSGRELEESRNVRFHLERDIAERVLSKMQHGQERASLVRVEPL